MIDMDLSRVMGDPPPNAPNWAEVKRATTAHGRKLFGLPDKPHIFLRAHVWHVRYDGCTRIYRSRGAAFMAAYIMVQWGRV